MLLIIYLKMLLLLGFVPEHVQPGPHPPVGEWHVSQPINTCQLHHDLRPRTDSQSSGSEWSCDVIHQSSGSEWSHDVISQSGGTEWSHDVISQSGVSEWSHDVISQSGVSEWSHDVISQSANHTVFKVRILDDKFHFFIVIMWYFFFSSIPPDSTLLVLTAIRVCLKQWRGFETELYIWG